MQRIRNDLNLFSDAVSKYVFDKNSVEYGSPESPTVQILMDELNEYLKPLEMRVTKSKERGKGYSTFMLFCTKNLRIYNNISEYIRDMDEYNKINPSLNTKISNMLNLSRINNELTNDVIDIDQEVF